MATNEVSASEVDQAEQAVDNGDGKRERSTIEFPYLDIDMGVEIAKGVHAVGGSSCEWGQLAAHLQQTAAGGAFRMRVMTAKTFGYVTYGGQIITLTDLGLRLCDPQQENAAKADGFLAVELYGQIYGKFKNVTLPQPDALEAEIEKLGVAPKQKGKARQAFMRSAKSAGFFWSGPNRLVKPATKASAAPDQSSPTPDLERTDKKKAKEDEERKHPLIEGLIKELPEPQSEWTIEARKRWLEAASTIFNIIFKDSDDSRGSLRIEVEKEKSSTR